MQTFLPYPSFRASAAVLDVKRLGKQRVEGLQLLHTITGRSGGWRHHPAAKMWAGHAAALASYTLAICEEWSGRGYKDTIADTVITIVSQDDLDLEKPVLPPWMIDGGTLAKVCSSHRSNLLAKLPSHYRLCGWSEEPGARYFWPPAPSPLPPLRGENRTMTENENVPEAPAAPAKGIDTTEFDAIVAKTRAEINTAIGEKNVAAANRRLDAVSKVYKMTLTKLAKQTAIATRPRRIKKVADAPVAQ